MGSYGLVGMGGSAAGPAVAGVLADATGNRRLVTIVVAACALAAAALALRIQRGPQGGDDAEVGMVGPEPTG